MIKSLRLLLENGAGVAASKLTNVCVRNYAAFLLCDIVVALMATKIAGETDVQVCALAVAT